MIGSAPAILSNLHLITILSFIALSSYPIFVPIYTQKVIEEEKDYVEDIIFEPEHLSNSFEANPPCPTRREVDSHGVEIACAVEEGQCTPHQTLVLLLAPCDQRCAGEHLLVSSDRAHSTQVSHQLRQGLAKFGNQVEYFWHARMRPNSASDALHQSEHSAWLSIAGPQIIEVST